MEDGQLEIGGTDKNLMGAYPLVGNPSAPVPQAEHYGSPKVVPRRASSAKKKTSTVDSHVSVEKNTPPTVSNCYIFKSRLQEYAQKAGIRTPVYETIKEGPSHEPSFRSTVIVNDVRYDSLPGFSNRKAAEQSAAEVALIELANLVDMKFGISLPVHDTGLCKNLLQEYAQKMNYAIPLYECHLDNQPGRKPMYSCVLEIGGIKYIGASTSTKKEAEIKVARVALLAIKSATSAFEDQVGLYTVLPHKKKVTGLGISTQETVAALKPKKGRFKLWKKKRDFKKYKFGQGQRPAVFEVNLNGQTGAESDVTGAVNSQHTNGADDLEVNVDIQEVPQASVADAVSSLAETPVGSDIGIPALLEVNLSGQTRAESDVTNAVNSKYTTGPDNLEVRVDIQEAPQVSVADAFCCLTETPVGSDIGIPVGFEIETLGTSHIDNPVELMEMPTVAQIETPVVYQIEAPGGLGGPAIARADIFQEPDFGLAFMGKISDLTHPETCNKNLEKPLASSDEGFWKDGESSAMDVEP